MMTKRLYRSRTDRMLSGVCGGFADYFGIDPTLIRLGVAALILITGIFPGVVFYIICAIIIPEGPFAGHEVHEAPTVVVEPKMDATSDNEDEDLEDVVVEPKMEHEESSKVNLEK